MSDAPETIWTWLATSRDGCDVLRAADHPRLDGFPTVEYRRADQIMADSRVKSLRDALGNLIDALTAEDKFRDSVFTITGSTANLKWLIEATEEACAKFEETKP